MPLLSVIIPVYNAQNYIMGIVSQLQFVNDFEIEIIIIDDGSTDGTLSLIKEYFNDDKRITIIHQHNQGVSCARNKGLSMAHGKYVAFFDADDYIDYNILTEAINEIESNDDVSLWVFGYQTEREDISVLHRYSPDNKIINFDDMLLGLFPQNGESYNGYLWNKIFRLDIIIKHEMSFAEDIAYNEDRLFIFNYVLQSSKVKHIPKIYYHYIQHGISALNGIISRRKLDALRAFEVMVCNLTDAHLPNKSTESILHKIYWNMSSDAIELYRNDKTLYRELLPYIHLNSLQGTDVVLGFMLKINPHIYDILYFIRHKISQIRNSLL